MKLAMCPFCNSGSTNIYQADSHLTDVEYALPKSIGGIRIYYALEHWCERIKETNARHISFYGKSYEEVAELWNLRN